MKLISKKMLEKMAKYLVDILGDQLLTEPVANYPVNIFSSFIFYF